MINDSAAPSLEERGPLGFEMYRDLVESVGRHGAPGVGNVTAIVVAYQTGRLLLRCVDSLLGQTSSAREVIVVDNGLDDATRAELVSMPVTHVLMKANLGPSPARNVGALLAESRYLAFIDDDGYVASDLVENIDRLLSDESVVAVRGRVAPERGAWSRNGYASHYYLGRRNIPSLLSTEGNMAIKRNVFLACGGFDDDLFGHEGLVLGYRLVEGGFCERDAVRYDPSLILYHSFAALAVNAGAKRERYKRLYEGIKAKLPGFDDYLNYYRMKIPKLVLARRSLRKLWAILCIRAARLTRSLRGENA